MLKFHSVDAREKENMFKSTDGASNASTHVTSYNKSSYEKIETPNDMFSTFEQAESTFENIEKQPTASVQIDVTKIPTPHSDYAEKHRSQSVDTYSKRKSTSTSYNGKL